MAARRARVSKVDQKGNPDSPEFVFWCPGCKIAHWFKTTGKEPRWGFNGDLVRPTITPSLRVRGANLCHSFVTSGSIRFLSDCDHELAGQTVAIPYWEGDDHE
jgi:hypothetical protein